MLSMRRALNQSIKSVFDTKEGLTRLDTSNSSRYDTYMKNTVPGSTCYEYE